MKAQILHSGFEGLKFTIQVDIPPAFHAELISAKEHAKKTFSDCVFGLWLDQTQRPQQRRALVMPSIS